MNLIVCFRTDELPAAGYDDSGFTSRNLLEAITKTLNLSHSTVRNIFELNTKVLLRTQTERMGKLTTVTAANQKICPHIASLRSAILSLPRLEQQELAALAWLGSEVFEDFDIALGYARLLKERELVEFLEIIPTFNDLDRGMEMIEDNAIHLS